jgi:hypothetical protein
MGYTDFNKSGADSVIIVGNFGEVFNLAKFSIDRQIIKNSPIELDVCVPMVVSIQIAKFKICQSYLLYGN